MQNGPKNTRSWVGMRGANLSGVASPDVSAVSGAAVAARPSESGAAVAARYAESGAAAPTVSVE